MNYEIYPLAITTPEWGIFDHVCQNYFNKQPIKVIDGSILDPNDPAAFLGLLDLEFEPVKALRESRHVLCHYSVSFLLVVDELALHQIANYTKLHVISKRARGRFVAIVSGTLDTWYQAIITGCKEYEIRWLMNEIYTKFKSAGFREIFEGLRRRDLPDGTFALY